MFRGKVNSPHATATTPACRPPLLVKEGKHPHLYKGRRPEGGGV